MVVALPLPKREEVDLWGDLCLSPLPQDTVSDLAQKNMLSSAVIICGATREWREHFAKICENETRERASVKALEFQTISPI